MRSGVAVTVSLLLTALLAGCLGDGGGKGPGASGGGGAGGGVGSGTGPITDTLGGVEGIVTDAAISVFFQGARITVTRSSITDVVANATTDAEGGYFVGGLAPGEYKVFAEMADHRPQGKTVNVVAGEVMRANFQLEPLPRVEPRLEQPVELVYYISCGMSIPLSQGDANTLCGRQDENQKTQHEFVVDPGLTTMVVSAKWQSKPCVGCTDNHPWLLFKLLSPASGNTYKSWSDPPSTSTRRYDFNLTEDDVKFTTGNWSLQVLPAPGDSSKMFAGNSGLVTGLEIEAFVSLGYDNYYVPPEHTGLPDE